MVSTTAIQTPLVGNLNANSAVSAYCAAIKNTTVAEQPEPGAWYKPFMTELQTAQAHATTFLQKIGPTCWSTIPNAVIQYGQTFANAMADVSAIVATANKSQGGVLTDTQLTEVIALFTALEQKLSELLGNVNDSNLTLANPTIYGCKNDLNTFNGWLATDDKALIGGQNGAAVEVGLLQKDEDAMNSNITELYGEIKVWNNIILSSEIGIGVSIFVAVVGVALVPETGGTSLVATATGIIGLGASIAGTVVYSDKVEAAQKKIAADQAALTVDQQQVNALNGIIQTIKLLSTENTAAQSAVETMVDQFTTLVSDTNTTVTNLDEADGNTAVGILETLDIQNAVSAWNTLVTYAQSVQGVVQNPQILTPTN